MGNKKKRTQEMLGSVLVSGWSSKWKKRKAGAKSRFKSLTAFWFKSVRESSLFAVFIYLSFEEPKRLHNPRTEIKIGGIIASHFMFDFGSALFVFLSPSHYNRGHPKPP